MNLKSITKSAAKLAVGAALTTGLAANVNADNFSEIPVKEDSGLRGATLLEFIESTGSQWIDSGFYVTEKSGFDLDVVCFNNISQWGFGCVMGAEEVGGRGYWWLGTYSHYASGGFDYAAAGVHYPGGFIKDQRVFTSFRNNIITYDPALGQKECETLKDSFRSNGTLGIFADKFTTGGSQGAKENARARIYELKLYEGDEIQRDYLPCVDPDGRICLYDCVQGEFAYNLGTDAFVTNGAAVYCGLRRSDVICRGDTVVAKVSRETDLRNAWKVYAFMGKEYHGTNADDWVADGGTAREVGRLMSGETLSSVMLTGIPEDVRYVRFVAVPTMVDNVVTAGRWAETIDFMNVEPSDATAPIVFSAQVLSADYASATVSVTCAWMGEGASSYDVYAVCAHGDGFVRTNAVATGATLVGSPLVCELKGLRPGADYSIYLLVMNDVTDKTDRYPATETLDFSTKAENVLPSSCTAVEYIQFSGGAYVDTGVVIDNHQIECRFWCPNSMANDTHLFGCNIGHDPEKFVNFTLYQYNWWWGVSGTQKGCAFGDFSCGEHTVVFNDIEDHKVYYDGTLMTLKEGSYPEGATTYDSNAAFTLLLGCRNGQSLFTGRVYSFKITATDGKVVCDLIPCCYRESPDREPVYGFYDAVRGEFLTSSAGTLTPGPESESHNLPVVVERAVLTVFPPNDAFGRLNVRLVAKVDSVKSDPAKSVFYVLSGEEYVDKSFADWEHLRKVKARTADTGVFDLVVTPFSPADRYVRFAVVPLDDNGNEDRSATLWSATQLVSDIERVKGKGGMAILIK